METLPAADHRSAVEAAKRQLLTARNFRLDQTLGRIERSYVEAALALTSGNLSQAAKLLGVHRTTLYSRMQTYGTETDHNAPDQ
jgi:DNA-binding NtrC family response regulator